MRGIKFRAWDKLKKSVHEVAVIDFVVPYAALWKQKGGVRSTYEVELDTIELMQCTGLKDKNGKEIYEGDVVKRYTASLPYEVLWISSAWWLRKADVASSFPIERHRSTEEYEVIGNIWENPELLEAKCSTL